MNLGNVEMAIRPEEVAHYSSPWPEVGQPIESTDAGVHNIELAVSERRRCVIHVRAHILDGKIAGLGQLRGHIEGVGGIVEPDDTSSATSPRHGVGANMA